MLLSLISVGCTRFTPRPIVPQQALEDFEARRLDAPELADFLVARDVADPWPPPAWDLRALTLAAFYYSPALDVARARWGVARGGVITAGGRPNPTLTAQLGYNASTPAGGITPWIPEGVLDLPLDIAGRRGIRVDEARRRSRAAYLDLVAEAWRVRSRVRSAFLDLYVAVRSDSLLTAQHDIQTEVVRIVGGRVAVGESPPATLTRARVALANSRVAALDAEQRAARARTELAKAVGVPPAALEHATLAFGELAHVEAPVPSREARRRALVSRSDVLAALAEYEASQAALRLEIRKQYPDISLGPGFQMDQTDAKWSLSLSLPLPFLNRNQGPIAEAMARRKVAAARFLARQSSVFSDIEAAVASARVAAAQALAADTLLAARARLERTARESYRIGEISRLELMGLRSGVLATALARVDALAKAQRAVGALEDAMQSPADQEKWVTESPRPTSGRHEDMR